MAWYHQVGEEEMRRLLVQQAAHMSTQGMCDPFGIPQYIHTHELRQIARALFCLHDPVQHMPQDPATRQRVEQYFGSLVLGLPAAAAAAAQRDRANPLPPSAIEYMPGNAPAQFFLVAACQHSAEGKAARARLTAALRSWGLEYDSGEGGFVQLEQQPTAEQLEKQQVARHVLFFLKAMWADDVWCGLAVEMSQLLQVCTCEHVWEECEVFCITLRWSVSLSCFIPHPPISTPHTGGSD